MHDCSCILIWNIRIKRHKANVTKKAMDLQQSLFTDLSYKRGHEDAATKCSGKPEGEIAHVDRGPRHKSCVRTRL
jgi:hypothetical protein